MPWPPPTHMVSRPMVLSWNWRLLIRVVAIRAPVTMAVRGVVLCHRISLVSAEAFEDQGHALAAADAHGLQPELLVVELQ